MWVSYFPLLYLRPFMLSGSWRAFCFPVILNEKLGPRGRAPSETGTTQPPPESLAHDDQSPWFPQTHDGAVPRRRSHPLKRRRLWCEEISGRGE